MLLSSERPFVLSWRELHNSIYVQTAAGLHSEKLAECGGQILFVVGQPSVPDCVARDSECGGQILFVIDQHSV